MISPSLAAKVRLRLLKVQRAGGKAMAADELLKGFALPKGTRFS